MKISGEKNSKNEAIKSWYHFILIKNIKKVFIDLAFLNTIVSLTRDSYRLHRCRWRTNDIHTTFFFLHYFILLLFLNKYARIYLWIRNLNSLIFEWQPFLRCSSNNPWFTFFYPIKFIHISINNIASIRNIIFSFFSFR